MMNQEDEIYKIDDVATVQFNERQLTDVLKELPDDHYLRTKLQNAGNNIFGWDLYEE